MKILGIDPGTAIIGYGLIEYKNNKINCIDYSCIYTHKDQAMSIRLEEIFVELNIIIEKFKPDAVAIEEIFYFKNNKTVISVSQARGVIILACQIKKIPIFEYTPLQVKMGITGYGRAEKKQVQIMVQKILNLKEIPNPDDAADALAIAITHINSNNNLMFNLNKKNKKTDVKLNSNRISAKDFQKLFGKE